VSQLLNEQQHTAVTAAARGSNTCEAAYTYMLDHSTLSHKIPPKVFSLTQMRRSTLIIFGRNYCFSESTQLKLSKISHLA